MKTLTEKFNAVLEGKFSKKQFVRDARLAHPQLVTQYNGYDDTVAILKNKGYIFEQIEKYKEEKLPAYDNGVTEADKHPLEAIERGVDYELEKKGFNTIQPDFSEDDYEKAKKKVIDNLEKNPSHYLNILADEPTRVQKNRKDVMKPVDKNNHVDKDNGMIKAELRESKKELGSILEPILDKVRDARRFSVAKQEVIDAIESSRVNQDSKDQMLQDVERIKNLPNLQKYVYNAYLAKIGLRSPDSGRGRKRQYQENTPINEGRRPKSKGGKVVKEDDYANGGYVELMSADLERGIRLVQKAWDDWKAGPMTEPGMIEYAKEDLIRHIHDSLTFFDEEDTVMETDLEGPLDEKKAQLKESFKKLIVKVLTEDKKKVNEEVEEINGHKVEHIQTVQDQVEGRAESYVVFLIDNEFLVVFAVVVGEYVPGANHKGEGIEIAAKYWFPGDLVIGMKDGLEKYAKGPTSRAKMTVKRIFRELAQDADYHMGTNIPSDITLDPEDYEYGDLDTIFENSVTEEEKQGFTLDGKVL